MIIMAEFRNCWGIIMRGMIVHSERWRVATIGDWEMTGTHLPQKEQKDNLFLVCKELYL